MRPSIIPKHNSGDYVDRSNSDEERRSTIRTLTLFGTDSQLSLDSEKSYDPLFKKTELYEFLTYLTFDLVWMFIAAFANVILFVLYTYEVVFDKNFSFYTSVLVIIIFCDAIIAADIMASVIHWTWKHYAALKNFPPRSKTLLIIDVVSVCWMFISFIPQLQRIKGIAITGIVLIFLRLYRVVDFFYVVSRTPGLGTFDILLEKYGVVIFIMVHMFACIIKAMGCYKCDGESKDWTSTVIKSKIYFDGETPGKWYIVCLYFILSSVSSVGFGDIHSISNWEVFLMVLVMLFGFFLIVGAFLGSMTAVLLESYRRHSTFSTRLALISKAMDHPKIPRKLKTKIIKFYYMFWQQQKGILISYLFEELPETMRQQVYLDKYWNALRHTYLLRNIQPAFRRAIAAAMTTEIYTYGEIIYVQGQQKDFMIYVMRGNVQILSAEDGESPILTLGTGTCLGEANLVYGFPSPVQVIASSYCEIQRLNKKDFWRVALKYYKLNQTCKIHEAMEKKMKDAIEVASDKEQYRSTSDEDEVEVERALKIVKTKLKVEDPKSSNSNSFKDGKRRSETFSETEYHDLYILSLHQTTLKHSDEICLRTSWPWALQPESVLLTIWEYFMCGCILTVAILYPYQISFSRQFPHFMTLTMVIIDGTYLIDIVLQIFTAVEDENGVITKVSDIFPIRCKKFSFILDIIAILPLTTFANVFHITRNQRLLTIFSINRLFKFHRVILLFRKLGASFHVNIAVVRCTKYVLYFLMLSYLMGAIFYMLACFNVVCLPNSWYDVIKTEDEALEVTRHQFSFELSIYYAALVISQTGFGDVTPKTMLEVVVTMIFFILGTLLFCYLVADYTATLMLAERQRQVYIEMVTVIRKFLVSNNMLMNIQYRTNEYLALQWRINKGYVIIKEQSSLFDVPFHLFEEQQVAKFFDILVNIPLFKELDHEYIKMIAVEVKQIFLPPHEIVTHAGEVVRNMYFIDRGFCEMISAASGKTERILGPASHFCDFDMVLGRPGIYHIQTVTHARVIKISYTTVKKVFVAAGLYEDLNKLANEIKSSLAVQRLFLRSDYVTYQITKEEQPTSWFIFPKRKLNLRNIDYERAFDNMGVWRFCKAFLMRRTILPHGNFLLIWEAIQAIRIFLMGLYFVSLCFVRAYTLHSHFVWLFFDFIGCVDLYIRMHVCYYNKRGILVTHPKFTALHYMSGGFIIDFLSVLPVPFILRIMLSTRQRSTRYKVENILRLNKLLPLYRISGVFSCFEMDILRTGNILLNIIKFLPISILFHNALTVILVTITCNFSLDNEGYFVITPNSDSWLGVEKDKRHFNVTVPINIYVSAFYWVTLTGLQVGFGNFKAWQKSEMYFIIIVVVAGYLFFTYILVLIASNKATINVNLTLYQERMKHLISFMNREKVNKELQGKVIDHYEYIWQRTHGMKASTILNKCHLALRKDSVLYLYEQTFVQVPVFMDMSKSFFRVLGMHVEEAYFLRFSTIIRLNDIISTIYIIHKGEATIKAPDGSTFAILTRGCMFGNIDNIRDSRSMTSVVASHAVDLLCINTEKLYNLAVDYPIIANRMRKYTLQENLSYIGKKLTREPMHIETDSVDMKYGSKHAAKQKFERKLKTFILMGSLPVNMMLISLSSCIIVMYHLAFQNHSIIVFMLTYTFDVFHLIKLYAGFYMPYRNRMGEMVTDLKKIRRRYLTYSRFYSDLLAVIPFEIFSVAVSPHQRLYYLTWLRVNRMLTMWNIHHFFNVTFDRLNINVLIIKLGSVCIYFLLMIHIASCFLYMAGCPAGKCLTLGWMYDEDGHIRNNNHYLLSVYFVLTMITSTGFGDVSPVTVPEMVLCAIIMLLGKFLIAIFIGDISAMVQSFSYTFVSYDYNMATLKEYLQRSYIVGPLINRILNYVNQLWKKDRGLHLPTLLEQAPTCMLEEVKAAAYGKHLFENYIFVSCHKDFLRQLIAKVKAHYFFQGDLICQQGDINNKMYFIHKGTVTVHIIDGHDEIQVEHLGELDCFGLVQGLFAFTPHTHTYKAETVAVILTLDLFEWVHLLKYYRAARHEIYSRIQRIGHVKE